MKAVLYLISLAIMFFAAWQVLGAATEHGSAIELFMEGTAISMLTAGAISMFRGYNVLTFFIGIISLISLGMMLYAMKMETSPLYFYYMLAVVAMHVHNGVRESYGKNSKEEPAVH
jgi:hypothetical protein